MLASGHACQCRLSGRTNCPAGRSPEATSTMRVSSAIGAGAAAGTSRAASCACSQLRAPMTVPIDMTAAIARKPRRRISMRNRSRSTGEAFEEDEEAAGRDGEREGNRLAQTALMRERGGRRRQASPQRRQHGDGKTGAGERGGESEAGEKRRRGPQRDCGDELDVAAAKPAFGEKDGAEREDGGSD